MQQETPSETDARHSRNREGGLGEDAHFSTVTSGRSEWRRDEHGRFMQALELYGSRKTGDEWKQITAFVGSRTIDEVRLHGRQYLKRLVQQVPASAEASCNLMKASSQDGVSRQKFQSPKTFDPRGGKRLVATSSGGNKVLNTTAFECAQSMRNQFPPQFHNHSLQLPQHQMKNAPLHRHAKPWTFQEDKAFETALARWAGGRSYPWSRIAAAIPGKNVKDVCCRYEEMVGEIACIESGAISVPPTKSLMSTLSQRAKPPPPIEVPLRSGGKDGGMGSVPSSRRSRSRRGSASGITMLSPTFLDYLTKEAESEEKSSLPTLSFPGQSCLPSPLFSPTLLPSGSSTNDKSSVICGQQSNQFSRSENDDSKMGETGNANSTNPVVKSEEPQNSRVLNEFLANEFRFDDPLGGLVNHSSRKSSPASLSEGSKVYKSDAGKQDDEMADASAA